MLLGALILFWFPLRGARLEKMQKDLLALHAEKKAKYEKQKHDLESQDIIREGTRRKGP